MADILIGALLIAVAMLVTLVALIRGHLNAAPAPALDPQVPARATKCPEIGHRMLLSDLGTWWVCVNDGCTQMWPADEAHHLDLPYDQDAIQLIDETEQYLRSAS